MKNEIKSYGKLNDLLQQDGIVGDISKEIFLKKYAMKDEHENVYEIDKKEMDIRVATGLTKLEKNVFNENNYNEYLKALNNNLVSLGGRSLYAIGNKFDKKSTTSNCYVITIKGDSIEDIGNANRNMMKIMSLGGGVGIDFSNLRPSEALVNNSAKTSSGPVSFMELFSTSTGIIAQSHRRGALMCSLSVNNPDILKFIKIKGGENKDKIKNANLSIRVTNEFMQLVINNKFNETWETSFEYYTNNKKMIYKKYFTVGEIWNAFLNSNWEGAEPGLLFWDNIINNDPAAVIPEFKPRGVNPCFIGDTIIATADGRNGVKIKELAKNKIKFPVYSGRKRKDRNGWKTEIKMATAFKTGVKKIIKICLSNGSNFKCTPDHLLALTDGKSYIEAQHSLGQKIEKFYSFTNLNTNKSYRTINSKTNGYSRQYRMIYEFFNNKYDSKKYNVDHIDNDSTNDLLENLQLLSIDEHNKKTKRTGDNNPIKKIKGSEFISLYSQRSNIQANGKRYNWSDDKINQKLYEWDLKNGERLNFLRNEKNSHNVYLDDDIYVIDIIDENEITDVYDLTVEDNHNFYIITKTNDDKFLNSSGVLVHNCAEEPLEDGGACVLGSIILHNHIENPFTKKAYLNFETLRNSVETAVKMLDSVVEYNKGRHPLELNEITAIKGRRIGLGFTGLADAFTMLNIKYDTKEAVTLTERICKHIKMFTVLKSMDLALDRGSCEYFTDSKNDKQKENYWNEFANHNYFDFLDIHKFGDLYNKDVNFNRTFIKKYGIRNIGFNTVAPNGSISIIHDNCSSGLEPVFSFGYTRKVKDKNDKLIDYDVVHHTIKKYEDITNKSYKDNPNFITSSKIDWKFRIKLQSAIQKYTSQSLSSTINLPNETSIDTINEIYKEAYKQNLKGVTIYRSGSREGVLIDNNENNNNNIKLDNKVLKNVKPLPETVDYTIRKIMKVEGKKWYIFITPDLETGLPYELFVNTNDTETTVMTMDLKDKLSELALKYLDKKFVIDLDKKAKYQTNVKKMARYLSLVLRHRIPIIEIIDVINKIEPPIFSFLFQIKKILQSYLDGFESKDTCPDCELSNLVYENGCQICKNCGYTKCS